MSTLAKFMILSGADNRPPMLEKHLYDSWKSIMELYMQNREHGRMILESVKHGPLIWPTIEENSSCQGSIGKSSTTNARYLIDKAGKGFQQQFSPSQSPQYGSIHPTQHYSTTYPSTPHAITYQSTLHPNAYSSTVHQDACPQPQSIPQIEYTVSRVNQQTQLAEFPHIDSGLAVSVFKQGDDPIVAINKMMSFLSAVVSSRFPTTNNQLRNSSNPRQQATIHDGRVTVQSVQERQSSFVAGTSGIRANKSGIGRNNSGQQRVVKCFNCQGEGHMARHCLKPKRKKDATWFRDKVLLVKPQGTTYQADDLDVYDSNCDDFSTAKAVLMANLSSYGSDVLSEVSHSDITHNYMLNQSVQEMQHSEQTHLVNYPENEITSDSNIIPYSQYLLET
ncbi:reverse transcriptase domain-containing protein [Tanacetum coccineum]